MYGCDYPKQMGLNRDPKPTMVIFFLCHFQSLNNYIVYEIYRRQYNSRTFFNPEIALIVLKESLNLFKLVNFIHR